MVGWTDYLPSWLGGSRITTADVPRPMSYPTADDVTAARRVDASYGDPSAAYVQPQPSVYGPLTPGQTYSGRLPVPSDWPTLQGAFNENAIPPSGPSAPVADNLMQGYLASRRTALGALGFDPHHMTIGSIPPMGLTINGQYTPNPEDMIVSSGNYPSTTVHESMHRGMEALRQANILPPEAAKMSEEAIVRANMLRNFGDVEVGRGSVGDQQIDDGRYYNRQFAPVLDQIESAAARLYAQRHPGGPR